MQLNSIKPAIGSKQVRKRLGRGVGSGLGKTCGKGHKGQHARSGGYHKVGFEGGQMPLQRRLPKYGFTSRQEGKIAEIRLNQLNKIDGEIITLTSLREAGLISCKHNSAKIILKGEITKAITLSGLMVTKGARKAIETAGGKVENE